MKKPAYKNVIVNGIVLAEDGKKMSKRLKNYPDPIEVFDKYGADVLRLYLLSSPVMAAENLSLKEKELVEISRGMFRMLWNSYYFFMLYANINHWQPKETGQNKSDNLLDRWIISKVEKLNLDLEKSMKKYDLVISSRLFPEFVDDLSNWYIRRSRNRFWKTEDDKDKNQAFATLHYVLVRLAKLLAPFTPFIAEEIFKNLTSKESVHLEDFPVADEMSIDDTTVSQMDRARKIVEVGLAKRAEKNIKVRQPLWSLSYGGKKLDEEFESIIAEEVNVKKVKNTGNVDEINLDTKITPELLAQGRAREIVRSIQSLRKKADFQVDDKVIVFYQTKSEEVKSILEDENLLEYIKKETLSLALERKKEDNPDCSEEVRIDNELIWLGVKRKK